MKASEFVPEVSKIIDMDGSLSSDEQVVHFQSALNSIIDKSKPMHTPPALKFWESTERAYIKYAGCIVGFHVLDRSDCSEEARWAKARLIYNNLSSMVEIWYSEDSDSVKRKALWECIENFKAQTHWYNAVDRIEWGLQWIPGIIHEYCCDLTSKHSECHAAQKCQYDQPLGTKEGFEFRIHQLVKLSRDCQNKRKWRIS